MAKKQTSELELPGFSARVPDLQPGGYKDGTSLHGVQFLECKIFLRPDRFTSAKSFREYGKLVKRAAEVAFFARQTIVNEASFCERMHGIEPGSFCFPRILEAKLPNDGPTICFREIHPPPPSPLPPPYFVWCHDHH
jgi:hypothetical protein